MGAGGTLSIIAFCLLALGLGTADAAEPDLRTLLEQARAAGPDGTPVGRLSIAQATSRQLLRQGDVDFKTSFDIDLALDAQPLPLDRILTRPVAETGRTVVIFDVALARASRKVRNVKPEPSQRVVERIKHENPAYRLAHKDLERTVKAADAYLSKGRIPPVKVAEGVQVAKDRLGGTPQHLEQAVYGPYEFRVANVEARKVLTVNYFVIDRVAKRYFKSVVDVVESQPFLLAFSIAASDPNQDRIRADHSFERDVKDWERAPMLVPLSQLLHRAAEREAVSRPFTSVDTLLAELAADRNAAVARLEAETFDDRPLNDPRFDSVVAVYNPEQGMGSGFYVRSNIVMTNYHVVEQHPIVELKLYDRRETFGQVIAKDVRLDLALIKVQTRGRPVEFFRGKDVRPGDTVEAIGHPQRKLFSVTRGIVSAIRKHGSDMSNDGGRGDKVLYIQTDADINHGNSGGPLFLGNKVVGITTWGDLNKVNGGVAPGLNFAVHYSEAVRFIDESLRGE
jgi:serine protease Do